MALPIDKLSNLYEQMNLENKFQGCIMLDTSPIIVSDTLAQGDLYYSDAVEGSGKYTQGIVSESVPHCTLLFGLQESGQQWRTYVDKVLEGWEIPGSVAISRVDSFDKSEYHCIVARLVPSTSLVEGHNRLRHLPHIDGFPDYKPHITLAYIKRDDVKRDRYIEQLNDKLALKRIPVAGINYGD